MKLSLRDHEKVLASYLPEFRSLSLSFGSVPFPRKKVVLWIPVLEAVRSLVEYDLGFLFQYDVFPPRILKFFGEWQLENRPMRVGDVIVQQAQVPPIADGLKFIFGVRVLTVHRSDREAGFSYGTLQGHPETGTNEFSICIRDEALFAAVQTLAAPGLFLSRLLASVFTKPYVAFCNRQALRTIKNNFLKHEDWETKHISKSLAKTGAWLQDVLPGEEPFIKPWMIDLADDHFALDITRARTLLGWEPKHSLRETLPPMAAALKVDPLQWYQENKLEPPSKLKEQAHESTMEKAP